MGTWGIGLYADDTAADLKTLLKDLRTFGVSGSDAARIASDQFDTDDPVFLFALADLLYKDGRLPDEVRDKALELIESENDLERWTDAADRSRRQKILNDLGKTLQTSPPPPKKLKKAFIDQSRWSVGEIIGYEHSEGLCCVLRVVGYFTKFGGLSPIFEALDWNDSQPPSAARAATLPLLSHQTTPPGFEDLVPGSNDPAVQLSSWKSKGWLPDQANWDDWKQAWRYPYFAFIRNSESVPELEKIRSICTLSNSPREFFPRVVPLNGWHLWKDLESVLARYFPRYRWDGWPSSRS